MSSVITDHPNICAIHDLAFDDGVHFMIMQHVEGSDVRELVNGRPLSLKSALSITIQVCEALVAADSRSIIHRDIKANNVMVTRDGNVKILDFGLAKLLDDNSGYSAERRRKAFDQDRNTLWHRRIRGTRASSRSGR